MILYYAVVALHVIVCIILVLVVLLQSGKGADLAGAFGGGGSQTAFGSRGPASFLSKMTTGAAVVFMITSLSLSMITFKREESKSVLETTSQQTAKPVQKAPTGAPVATPTQEQILREQEKAEEAARKQKQTAPEAAPAPANQPASSQTGSKPPAK